MTDSELLPARMLNEWVYCPRLTVLEHVQGEWAESAETEDGHLVHRRVDEERGAWPLMIFAVLMSTFRSFTGAAPLPSAAARRPTSGPAPSSSGQAWFSSSRCSCSRSSP